MLFSHFDGSNEGMIGREAEMRGFMVKCGDYFGENVENIGDDLIFHSFTILLASIFSSALSTQVPVSPCWVF